MPVFVCRIKDIWNMSKIFFPPEWFQQSAVQLTWPHDDTDWAGMMDEVIPCFVAVAKEIMKHERLVIVCRNAKDVYSQLGEFPEEMLSIFELPLDDTWARDHGPISVFKEGKPIIYDFTFNGWGNKFFAENDNRLTSLLYDKGAFCPEVSLESRQPFVLEGGSIDTNGDGCILTTESCLLAKNRNQPLSKSGIEDYLKKTFGAQQILWIKNGYLAGDDTDGHIDMLARFCSEDTIAYVSPDDEADEHTPALKEMEKEIKSFRRLSGEAFRTIKLPMADPVYFNDERLPASYANFLILNGTVLLPFYGTPKDNVALKQLQAVFPGREVAGINCLPLIRQHGSLHCITMQYPENFLPGI